MSASDESHTQQDAAHSRDALADMQARLTQFGRLVGQVRDGLPEQHAEALGRIEHEIDSLGERIAAFVPHDQRAERASAAVPPAAPADPDSPWDPQSAEALMQAYESVDVQLSNPGPQRTPPHHRQWAMEAETSSHAPSGSGDSGPPWLEARFADIAALLQRALADTNPASSLSVLDRRLDQFEQRLDAALGDLAQVPHQDGLKLIDVHVAELAAHVGAIRHQLGRLDAMDGQLCDLARKLEDREVPQDGTIALSEADLGALVDAAVEHAANRIAASQPAEQGNPGQIDGRIDALETLLQDYIAERRRSDQVTAGILHTIDDALVRIVDRVEAMEVAGSAAEPSAHADAAGHDDMDIETKRLAEAYAAGARVLGHQAADPSLHAADYVASDRRDDFEMPAEPLLRLASDEPAMHDDQARQELRASALRAKLKAQGVQHEPAADRIVPEASGIDSASPDEAKAGLGQGRIRTWTSARPGSHLSSLLLGGAMVLLFGAGFVAVDSFLSTSPTAGAAQRMREAQPAAETANPASGPAASPGDSWKAQPAPNSQPALRRPTPDAATEDAGQPQPAPTRRLYRLQSGTAAAPSSTPGATPAMLSSPDATATPAGGIDAGSEAEIPPAIGTARLRQAAAGGDAFAQFEIATRFAEGKGVAQDQNQAFAWYERAASRGLASAQYRLAAYFERGVGTAADPERAKVWYTRAADQGYVRAMHNLGVLTVGTGERQADYIAAARWFQQAADRGLADSQFNLAILHENGRGVPKSLQDAYKWFALAARSGDPAAARRLEQVRARLTPTELESAEDKLAAWSPVASEPVTGSIGARLRR